jgi:hypothetical protein
MGSTRRREACRFSNSVSFLEGLNCVFTRFSHVMSSAVFSFSCHFLIGSLTPRARNPTAKYGGLEEEPVESQIEIRLHGLARVLCGVRLKIGAVMTCQPDIFGGCASCTFPVISRTEAGDRGTASDQPRHGGGGHLRVSESLLCEACRFDVGG